MKNIEDFMSRFSKQELNEGIERVKAIMNTPDGERIRRKLSGMDKRELIKKLNELDLSHSAGAGGGASNREIIDKLNQFCDRK